MRLRNLTQSARERSDVLIFTGGLGPTADDLTKETVAEVFGDTLVADPEEIERLRKFFASLGRKMSDNNLKQAFVPQNGKKLVNNNGTAPGAFFRQGNKMAFLLPGPPSEMKPMFFEQVRPLLENMQDSVLRSLTLHLCGIGESDLEQKVSSLLENQNPTAALYAKPGEVHIRITAKAQSADQADAMCDEYADLFRAVVGGYIYSDDGKDLESTVVSLLQEHGETLATAESCTGGMLSSRITAVSGASEVFGFGACTYANAIKHSVLGVHNSTLKRYGAVSSQVAAEMAFGAITQGSADYGVGITGIAGPGGGTKEKPVGLVYVAVASGKHVYVKKLNIAGRSRDYVRILACQNALDMVRRVLLSLPIEGAKEFARGHHADFERAGKPVKRRGIFTRIIASLLIILALLGALLLGLHYSRQTAGLALHSQTPAEASLRYGSKAYTDAAIRMVQAEKEANPSVTGLIAFPDAMLEQLVAQVRHEQAGLLFAGEEAGSQGMGVVGSNQPGFRSSKTILVSGGLPFSSLMEFQQPEKAGTPSAFTYFTTREAKEYLIYSILLLDKGETQPDSFSIDQLSFANQQEFLAFFIGSRARSLYDFTVDVNAKDSFMTLTAQDPEDSNRILVVCGRMLRPQETTDTLAKPAAAGAPLLPASYYKQEKQTKPSVKELSAYWMDWYLTRHLDNSSLQLAAGMPAKDQVPYLPFTEEELALLEPPASESIPQESLAESLAESGSTSSLAAGADSGSESIPAEASSLPPEEVESAAPLPASSAPLPKQKRVDAATLTVTMNGKIVTDTTLSILAQMCQREAAFLGEEGIKAYAVAAHSWIRNQQGNGTLAPQVVGCLPSQKILGLVEQVSAQLLSADSVSPAFTPFFPTAASGTNAADVIWPYSRSYLKPVASPQDKATNDWYQSTVFTQQEIAAAAEQLLQLDLTETPAEKWFTDIQKNDSGYLVSFQLAGKKHSGLWLWQSLLLKEGAVQLNSPAIEIEFDGENFIFTSYGKGHGCGLSFTGAAAMAKEGKSYQEILQHYYTGAVLMEWH